VAALPAVADAHPATYLAAVVAHLAGRGVYAVMRGELHRLDTEQLARGGPRLPLHVAHACPPVPSTRVA
jgi:hypothetical protein